MAHAPGSIEAISEGRYRKLQRLGGGATAEVDLVEEEGTGVVWVAKRYHLMRSPDWKTWELIERGARVQSRLDHPALPRLEAVLRSEHDHGATLWIVEEYIPGKDLAELVGEAGPLPTRRALAVGRGILDVLAYLHGQQPPVVHRDVKPSNVLLRPEGTVAVIDFGAVQEALRRGTMGGSTVVGTFGYMPPEQYMGRAEPASDLYAAAATILYCATGREPADLPIRDMRLDLSEVLRGRRRLRHALDAMLEPRVERRARTAGEALALLAEVQDRSGLGPGLGAGGAAGGAPGAPITPEPALPDTLAAFLQAAPRDPVHVIAPGQILGEAVDLECPNCRRALHAIEMGEEQVQVDACTGCSGVWVERGELDQLVRRPFIRRPDLQAIGRQVAALRLAPDPVVYRPCPACHSMMNRRNFARLSGVIIDECVRHGLWLDRGELEAILASDFTSYLPDDILTKVDRMSMAHSLEVRVPLLDHEVVELVARLPMRYKLAGGVTKYLLRELIGPHMPQAILGHAKQGFSVPLAAWFRGPLRATLSASLFEGALLSRGLCRREELERLYKIHQDGDRDLSWHLWQLLVLERWLGTPR